MGNPGYDAKCIKCHQWFKVGQKDCPDTKDGRHVAY
jgi:hypothetical protein